MSVGIGMYIPQSDSAASGVAGADRRWANDGDPAAEHKLMIVVQSRGGRLSSGVIS